MGNRYLFGRSKNIKVNGRTCEETDGPSYMKDLNSGDFVFLQNREWGKGCIHLLLECTSKINNKAEYNILIDFKDNPIPTRDFQRLIFFKLNIGLLNRISKQNKGNGFFVLDVAPSKQKALDDWVKKPVDFKGELENTSGELYRNLMFASTKPTATTNDVVFFEDKEDKSNMSGIRYKDEDFMDPWDEKIDKMASSALDSKPNSTSSERNFRNWINKKGESRLPSFQDLYNVLWQKGTGKRSNKAAEASKNSVSITSDSSKIDISENFSWDDFRNRLKDAKLSAVGCNRIYFGIPGCGKSYKVNHLVAKECYFRTVFYEDYSYSDFVGQYSPKSTDKEGISYSFTPGPFAKALKEAYDSIRNGEVKLVYLVIEEINRGKAPSIFGDTFQLLDRDGEGWSEYGIENNDLLNYLKRPGMKEIRLPGNLIILATMNTADQNVFTLDTAFKRRFEFEEVVDDWSTCAYRNYLVPGTDITWEQFVKGINKKIIDLKVSSGLSDDKRLASHFLSSSALIDPAEKFDWGNPSHAEAAKKFAYKVIEYLYDDVVRWNPNVLFASKIRTLSDAINALLDRTQNPKDLKDIFTNVTF